MTTPLQNLGDRDLRQRELVPPDRLAECRAMVVGVGAMGRQVALQLAAVFTVRSHPVVASGIRLRAINWMRSRTI